MTPDPLDRLNARDTRSPRRPLRAIMIAMLIAFAGGLALMAWVVTRWPLAPRDTSETTTLPVPAPQTDTLPKAISPTPAPAATPNAAPGGGLFGGAAPATPSTDMRVAALEAKLAEIDKHAALASDQAARAEGMLLAFSARRAIDRGVTLGYLEGALSRHFGADQPRAVASIIAASHAPVTLVGLRASLDNVTTEANPGAGQGDWWAAARAKLGGLIAIRRAGEPVTPPDERLARARMALASGAVDAAMVEVARTPGGPNTNAWLANARRYVEAHTALDLLEAAAILKGDVHPAPAAGAAPAHPAPTPPPAPSPAKP